MKSDNPIIEWETLMFKMRFIEEHKITFEVSNKNEIKNPLPPKIDIWTQQPITTIKK